MSTSKPSFRLDQQPWIPCVMQDGSFCELSLLDVLRQSRQIQRIAGNPLETATILRLLLAIAHVVGTPQDEFEWLDIWKAADQHLERMIAYVEQRADVFDLYDADRPFAQHPRLEYGSTTPAVLVYERAQGNNQVFLDHSRVDDPQPLTSAEAARALLVAHAYGGSGTGSNNPLNGGKKDSMLAGPLCARLIGVVEGQNLLDTIVLNLASNVRCGKPAWERPVCTGPSKTPSQGVADLYTRNTRAVRLTPNEDGSRCVAVAIFQGEAVANDEDAPIDPMIPRYRASDKRFKPVRLNPDRAMWRDAHVLLAASSAATAIPIRALPTLRVLASSKLLSEGAVSLRILGIAADAQGPVTSLWRDETLPFGLSVITDDARYAAMTRAVALAEEYAIRTRKRIYGFAHRYLQDSSAASPDKQTVSTLADELSSNLCDFWSTLSPVGQRIACDGFDEDAWAQLLRKTSEAVYQQAINRLPPDARRFRAQFAKRSDDSGAVEDGRPKRKAGKGASKKGAVV